MKSCEIRLLFTLAHCDRNSSYFMQTKLLWLTWQFGILSRVGAQIVSNFGDKAWKNVENGFIFAESAGQGSPDGYHDLRG